MRRTEEPCIGQIMTHVKELPRIRPRGHEVGISLDTLNRFEAEKTFCNSLKPLNVSFEPKKHQGFADFEAAYDREAAAAGTATVRSSADAFSHVGD